MKIKIFFLAAVLLSTSAMHAQPPGWHLVWSDEFNYSGLPDTTKWGNDTGGEGWGNNELEYYTRDSNAIVKDGRLYITARKEARGKNGYTSARMVTKGKGDWLYGRIEVRAQLPKGRGLWPAIWMLPTGWEYGGWPASGEIDIMEHVGYMPDSIFGSVHTLRFNHKIGTQVTKGMYVKDLYKTYHIYALEWDHEQLRFFLDGKEYQTFSNTGKGSAEWPFDKPFHLLLNVAVGGGWGGQKGVDESVYPQSMRVDYVRVYQKM